MCGRSNEAMPEHLGTGTLLGAHGHMWPDADESARAALAGVLAVRADSTVPRVAD